jgi:hypothetical protein
LFLERPWRATSRSRHPSFAHAQRAPHRRRRTNGGQASELFSKPRKRGSRLLNAALVRPLRMNAGSPTHMHRLQPGPATRWCCGDSGCGADAVVRRTASTGARRRARGAEASALLRPASWVRASAVARSWHRRAWLALTPRVLPHLPNLVRCRHGDSDGAQPEAAPAAPPRRCAHVSPASAADRRRIVPSGPAQAALQAVLQHRPRCTLAVPPVTPRRAPRSGQRVPPDTRASQLGAVAESRCAGRAAGETGLSLQRAILAWWSPASSAHGGLTGRNARRRAQRTSKKESACPLRCSQRSPPLSRRLSASIAHSLDDTAMTARTSSWLVETAANAGTSITQNDDDA